MFFKKKNNPNCKKCKLNLNCRNPKTPYWGNGELGILILEESPSIYDDDRGDFEKSDVRKTISNELEKLDIDMHRDCHFATVVACAPLNDMGAPIDTEDKHIEYCSAMVENLIKELKPKVIITMGISATRSLVMGKIDKIHDIEKWRGRHIPLYEYNTWLCPTFDAKWFDHHQDDEQAKLVFSNDLIDAVNYVNKEVPTKPDWKKYTKILIDFDEIVQYLKHIKKLKPKELSYDFETNSRRPYISKAKPLTMSMYCKEYGKSVSFPLKWRTHYSRSQYRIILQLIKDILEDPEIGCIAHNLSMEDSWSCIKMGITVGKWLWDTMIVQHIIDVTPKTKGLKYQCFVRWGVIGYDSYVKPYFDEDDEDDDGNSLNKLEEANLIKVLEYNALDSYFGYLLYLEQVDEVEYLTNEKRKYCVDLYNEVAVALTRTSQSGLRINEEYFEEKRIELEERKAILEKEFMKSNAVLQFKLKMKRELKISSSDDLRILFYDIIGYEAKKKTAKGANCADHEALTNMDDPLATSILQIRKLDKILTTYIGQFQRLSVNGLLHPDFLLHVARSGRSSCVSPNMQNITKRDPEAKMIVRSGIIPLNDYLIGEIDYDTLEVKIFACFCKDPALINYLLDSHSDMHRDQAMKIFMLDDEHQITKTIRFEAKNGWVFALFYGSYWKSCARKIWEKIISQKDLILGKKKDKDGNPIGPDIHLKDHLKKKGIRNQEDFAQHLKKCEEKLWSIFHVTREYQQNAFKFALEHGYVESYFGFRRGGYIERGQIINTPVQGQGCQCLLHSYRQLYAQSVRQKWLSKYIGQIHDSMLLAFHPTEVVGILNAVYTTMCTKMVKENDWLIVPMGIEASIAKKNDPWYSLIDFKKENGVWVQAKSGEPIIDILELPKQRRLIG